MCDNAPLLPIDGDAIVINGGSLYGHVCLGKKTNDTYEEIPLTGGSCGIAIMEMKYDSTSSSGTIRTAKYIFRFQAGTAPISTLGMTIKFSGEVKSAYVRRTWMYGMKK